MKKVSYTHKNHEFDGVCLALRLSISFLIYEWKGQKFHFEERQTDSNSLSEKGKISHFLRDFSVLKTNGVRLVEIKARKWRKKQRTFLSIHWKESHSIFGGQRTQPAAVDLLIAPTSDVTRPVLYETAPFYGVATSENFTKLPPCRKFHILSIKTVFSSGLFLDKRPSYFYEKFLLKKQTNINSRISRVWKSDLQIFEFERLYMYTLYVYKCKSRKI